MSATVTQAPAVTTIPYVVRIPSFAEKIQKFVHGLSKELSALSSSKELVNKITIWFEALVKDGLSTLTTTEKKLAAAERLCFLMCEVIYPVIKDNNKDLDLCLSFQKFNDEIIELLKELLPANVSAEKFAADYLRRFLQQGKFEKQLETMNILFQKEMDMLCSNANDVAMILGTKFDSFKEKILGFNFDRKDFIEDPQHLSSLELRLAEILIENKLLAAQIYDTGNKTAAAIDLSAKVTKSVQDIEKK